MSPAISALSPPTPLPVSCFRCRRRCHHHLVEDLRSSPGPSPRTTSAEARGHHGLPAISPIAPPSLSLVVTSPH
nr:hypothetical protein CFP56_00839 [Quercus suber]